MILIIAITTKYFIVLLILILVMGCIIAFLFGEVMALRNEIDEIKGNYRTNAVHIGKLYNKLSTHDIKKPKS